MKNNKLIAYLLAGALLGQNLPAHSMDLNQLSPLVIGGTAAAILYARQSRECHAKKSLFENDKKAGKKLHQMQLSPCIAAEESSIQATLQAKAKTDHGIEDVTFLPWANPDTQIYHTRFPQNIIYMPQAAYSMLLYENHPRCKKRTVETVMDNEPISLTQLHIEGSDMNEAIIVPTHILNYSTSTTEHELGHVKHGSGIKKIRLSCSWPLIAGLSSALSSPALKDCSLLAKCIAHLGLAGLSYGVNQILNVAYGKYDEVRADDNVPNDPALLNIQASFFQDKHNDELEAVKTNMSQCTTKYSRFIASIIPTRYWDKYPGITMELLHLTEDHPSPYYRMNRFKNRLTALENSKKI